MLVLLSFGLVLVATVLLVLGLLVDSGLSLIYASIALSVVAAVVLFVAVRVSKPKEAAPIAPAPLVPDADEAAVVTTPVPDAVGAATASTTALPAVAAGADEEWLAADQGWDETEETWDGDEGLEFPIADYDELTAEEILPLVPQLYSDEIPVVAARERAGSARPEILDALARAAAADGMESEPSLPIADYDDLSVSEIISVLGELDESELREVQAYESARDSRKTILTNIERRLGLAATTARRAAAKRPAAKKAASKKAPPATKKVPAAATGPFGAGSAVSGPRGGQPVGFPIKANPGSMVYHGPDSPTYARMRAEVYFASAAHAERAGFRAAARPGRKPAAASAAPAKAAPAKKAATRKAPAKKAPAKKAVVKKAAARRAR